MLTMGIRTLRKKMLLNKLIKTLKNGLYLRQQSVKLMERSPIKVGETEEQIKRRRVEQDYDNGKGSFLDLDNKTSILTLTQSPVINYSYDGDNDN